MNLVTAEEKATVQAACLILQQHKDPGAKWLEAFLAHAVVMPDK